MRSNVRNQSSNPLQQLKQLFRLPPPPPLDPYETAITTANRQLHYHHKPQRMREVGSNLLANIFFTSLLMKGLFRNLFFLFKYFAGFMRFFVSIFSNSSSRHLSNYRSMCLPKRHFACLFALNRCLFSPQLHSVVLKDKREGKISWSKLTAWLTHFQIECSSRSEATDISIIGILLAPVRKLGLLQNVQCV